MFDLQTHVLPEDRDELAQARGPDGLRQHAARLRPRRRSRPTTRTAPRSNRKMLDHLLHDAFSGDAATEPEVDLVNDPDPPPERIQQVLGRYPFEDVPAAYENLMALATEKIRFLSTRRCRHFLAAIAPRLLAAIAATPEPDTTLVNLSRVSDSLGGKAALWELFSFNRPSLELYVRLCAACPYLVEHPHQQPGHDRRADGQPARRAAARRSPILEQSLAELCRGAEDLDPILHSFKNAQHLRVGVRDVARQGRRPLARTQRWPTSPKPASSKSPPANTRSSSKNSASRRSSAPAKWNAGARRSAQPVRRPSSLAALRRPRRRRLRAGRPRPRQARRPRAELPQRSRPDLPVRSRRQHARPTPRRRAAARPTAISSASSASA